MACSVLSEERAVQARPIRLDIMECVCVGYGVERMLFKLHSTGIRNMITWYRVESSSSGEANEPILDPKP